MFWFWSAAATSWTVSYVTRDPFHRKSRQPYLALNWSIIRVCFISVSHVLLPSEIVGIGCDVIYLRGSCSGISSKTYEGIVTPELPIDGVLSRGSCFSPFPKRSRQFRRHVSKALLLPSCAELRHFRRRSSRHRHASFLAETSRRRIKSVASRQQVHLHIQKEDAQAATENRRFLQYSLSHPGH